MIPPVLQERFDLLLTLAKDEGYALIARENLAAARELVDTLFAVQAIGKDEFTNMHTSVTCAALVVSSAELARAQAVTFEPKE